MEVGTSVRIKDGDGATRVGQTGRIVELNNVSAIVEFADKFRCCCFLDELTELTSGPSDEQCDSNGLA